MSLIPKHLPELVEHLQVAQAWARALGVNDPVFSHEMDVSRTGDSHAIAMLEAIRAGELKTRNRITGVTLEKASEDTLFHFLHPDDVNRWLESLGLNYRHPARPVQTPAQANDTKGNGKRWTDDLINEARAMSTKLKAAGVSDYAKRTADFYSVTTARLREVLRHDRKRKTWYDV